MKKILFLAFATAFISCKQETNSNPEEEVAINDAVTATTENMIDSTAIPATEVAVDNTNTENNSIMYSKSGSVYNTTPTTTTTTTTVAPVSVAKGMNPSHGQSGHRCDIPVGAPLNSKPGAANTTTNAGTATISSAAANGTIISNGAKITTTTTNSPTVTLPGMNPPHGEEGHRCDLAVGAPLNSAAVPTVANESKE